MILHFFPQRRLAQAFFDNSVTLSPAHSDRVQGESGRDVVLDGHGRKRRGFLEDHPDSPPNLHRVDPGGIDVLSVEKNFTVGMRAGNHFVHPVQAADHSRFPAS